jgi:hypothetical protein
MPHPESSLILARFCSGGDRVFVFLFFDFRLGQCWVKFGWQKVVIAKLIEQLVIRLLAEIPDAQ